MFIIIHKCHRSSHNNHCSHITYGILLQMMNSKKNKKRKQLALGIFFQPTPKRNPDGTLIQTIIPSVASNSAQYERTIKCKSEKCTMTFRTTQVLGSHLNTCQYYKEDIEQKPVIEYRIVMRKKSSE